MRVPKQKQMVGRNGEKICLRGVSRGAKFSVGCLLSSHAKEWFSSKYLGSWMVGKNSRILFILAIGSTNVR